MKLDHDNNDEYDEDDEDYEDDKKIELYIANIRNKSVINMQSNIINIQNYSYIFNNEQKKYKDDLIAFISSKYVLKKKKL